MITTQNGPTKDFHPRLKEVLEVVCVATGWNVAEAWIVNEDKTVLECSSAYYTTTSGLEKFRKLSEKMFFASGIGLPGRVWSSKRPEWDADVSEMSENLFLRASIARQVGIKAGLGIPVLDRGEVRAVMVFYMLERKEQDRSLVDLILAAIELGLLMKSNVVSPSLLEDYS
jgi:GAF domain